MILLTKAQSVSDTMSTFYNHETKVFATASKPKALIGLSILQWGNNNT